MTELTEKDRTPPKSAIASAKKVLEWRDEHGDEVKGMTEVGWTRANQIASGKPLSLETIKRISQFARHEKNSKINPEYEGTPWKDNGYVSWLGWGGDSAILEWAPRIIDKSEQKENAKQMPDVYYCRHMYAGLAGYDKETALVQLDAMKKMAGSFCGKPVYVFHQDVDIENIQNADGFVSDCWYEPRDGWLWAKFIAVSDDCREAIVNGWSVSNAYIPTEKTGGGTHTNIEYDFEITNGVFTHLAIVPNPRYEKALIMDKQQFLEYNSKLTGENEIKNSKSKGLNMQFWKTKKEEVKEIDSDTMVTITNSDGSEHDVKVEEMINVVLNAEKEEDEKINMDMEVEVGKDKMPLKELINKYMNRQKNAEDEDMGKEDEKENQDDMDKKDDEEEKKNSKHFDELKNAHKPSHKVKFETSMDMVKRGKSKYGSNK